MKPLANGVAKKVELLFVNVKTSPSQNTEPVLGAVREMDGGVTTLI